MHEDETVEFWASKSHEHLALTSALLHRERREFETKQGYYEVRGARTLVANAFLSGVGLEVGAGNRPFPVPASATVAYGDIRDDAALVAHFVDKNVAVGDYIDAETFGGVADEALDFVISAHVIEHLANPFGSIKHGLRCLRAGGLYVIAVPDMRHTVDRERPPTPFEHLMKDFEEGGRGSLLDAYTEHCRYVHPLFAPAMDERQIIYAAMDGMRRRQDIHVHSWTYDTFRQHLDALGSRFGFAIIFGSLIWNEAIFVLEKQRQADS